MSAETDAYARQLRWTLDQVAASLRRFIPAQLNWRPPTGAANGAYAIIAHVIGSTRVYALGFGCGLPVRRDRMAEFAASGDDLDALIAQVGRLSPEIEAALAALEPALLDERIVPSKELWGMGEPHETTRRDALVESIRHAGIHLGEPRLTRDLADQATRRRGPAD